MMRSDVSVEPRWAPRLYLGAALTVLMLCSMTLVPRDARATRLVVAGQVSGTPESIDAAECTVEPRRFDVIAELAATPVNDTAPEPGNGVPAEDEVVAGVTETVRMAVACANANDPLRSYALFTDRYLAERFGPDYPDDLGSLFAALSREPSPADEADRLSLVEIRDVTALDADWVEAVVVTEHREARFVDRLVFQLVGERWLIDRWSPVEDVATPAA
jgi:hypothetical protein